MLKSFARPPKLALPAREQQLIFAMLGWLPDDGRKSYPLLNLKVVDSFASQFISCWKSLNNSIAPRSFKT